MTTNTNSYALVILFAKLPISNGIKKNALALVSIITCTLFACNTDAKIAFEDHSIQEAKRAKNIDDKVRLQKPVDSIVVYKAAREMKVFAQGKKLKTYIISLGKNAVGAKRSEGDYKTPEGIYYINDRNANSIYHKNLGVSYPNNKDRAYANQHKLKTGGDIKIHGLPNNQNHKTEDYLAADWTWGCIAVSNEEIDELFRYVKAGAVINILP